MPKYLPISQNQVWVIYKHVPNVKYPRQINFHLHIFPFHSPVLFSSIAIEYFKFIRLYLILYFYKRIQVTNSPQKNTDEKLQTYKNIWYEKKQF